MSRFAGWKTNQTGSALLLLLIMVALLGLMAGLAGSTWQTITQRAKEEDLLWKGDQIRRAIGRYYESGQAQGAGPKEYPADLQTLLHDQRYLETRRYLRQLYVDPMTGDSWELIKHQNGRIIGVKSGSEKKPFKQDNFLEPYRSFAGQPTYSGWHFIYQPETTKQQPAPAAEAEAEAGGDRE